MEIWDLKIFLLNFCRRERLPKIIEGFLRERTMRVWVSISYSPLCTAGRSSPRKCPECNTLCRGHKWSYNNAPRVGVVLPLCRLSVNLVLSASDVHRGTNTKISRWTEKTFSPSKSVAIVEKNKVLELIFDSRLIWLPHLKTLKKKHCMRSLDLFRIPSCTS